MRRHKIKLWISICSLLVLNSLRVWWLRRRNRFTVKNQQEELNVPTPFIMLAAREPPRNTTFTFPLWVNDEGFVYIKMCWSTSSVYQGHFILSDDRCTLTNSCWQQLGCRFLWSNTAVCTLSAKFPSALYSDIVSVVLVFLAWSPPYSDQPSTYSSLKLRFLQPLSLCLHLVFPFPDVEGKWAHCTVSLQHKDTSWGGTAPVLISENQGIIPCARVWWLSVVATRFKGFMPYNWQTDRSVRAHPPHVESNSLSAAGIVLKHTHWQGHNHQTDINSSSPAQQRELSSSLFIFVSQPRLALSPWTAHKLSSWYPFLGFCSSSKWFPSLVLHLP